MIFRFQAGAFALAVDWQRKESAKGFSHMENFYSGYQAPLESLEVLITKNSQETFLPPSNYAELPGHWRAGKEGQQFIVQFWCDGEKMYALEARFSEDYKNLQLCAQASHPKNSHLSFLLSSALRWQILHRLILQKGFLLHGAGIQQKDFSFLATGPSGAGKSTLSSFFAASKNFRVLSDETVMLLPVEGNWQLWGSPWPGLLEASENAGARLKEIFFLVKNTKNAKEELSQSDAFKRIWSECFVPPVDLAAQELLLQNIQDFLKAQKPSLLHFKKSPSIVHYLEEQDAKKEKTL